MRDPKVTVKIPRPLYERIQQVIEGSGFSSPTDFVVFVLRDLVGDRALERGTNAVDGRGTPPAAQPAATGKDDIDEIRRKLQNLGYL